MNRDRLAFQEHNNLINNTPSKPCHYFFGGEINSRI